MCAWVKHIKQFFSKIFLHSWWNFFLSLSCRRCQQIILKAPSVRIVTIGNNAIKRFIKSCQKCKQNKQIFFRCCCYFWSNNMNEGVCMRVVCVLCGVCVCVCVCACVWERERERERERWVCVCKNGGINIMNEKESVTLENCRLWEQMFDPKNCDFYVKKR